MMGITQTDGAGVTEAQGDWTVQSILADYVLYKTLSRRKTEWLVAWFCDQYDPFGLKQPDKLNPIDEHLAHHFQLVELLTTEAAFGHPVTDPEAQPTITGMWWARDAIEAVGMVLDRLRPASWYRDREQSDASAIAGAWTRIATRCLDELISSGEFDLPLSPLAQIAQYRLDSADYNSMRFDACEEIQDCGAALKEAKERIKELEQQLQQAVEVK